MDSPQIKSRLLKSPALIVLIVAASVFVSEASVMLLLYILPPLSVVSGAFLDATLLVALMSPTLYFFLFRPFVIHIRERERIEEILRKNEEEQFKVMIRTSLDAFLISDMHGRILEVNDAYCDLFGYRREELLGMNTADIEAADARADTAGHVSTLLETGSDRFETRMRRKDGGIQIVEQSSNYSNLHGGRIYSFLRDVTERRQAEEHREQLMQGLESANEELNNFAYVVSHDLKAPLRGISSLANWLSADYADKFDDAGREQMRLLINRVHRMDGLIDGILQYSRVGRVKETMVPVDLAQLVPEIIDLIAAPENISITIEDPLPTITAEPTRIQQVFQNLLSNAVKYMDKPEGRIRISCRSGNRQWTFAVSDNGPGIKQQNFEKIFQLFQTLAPRDRVESTGVGLALVRKIVEMYGGRVWVESSFGDGATFRFTLPHKHVIPISIRGR